MKWVLVYWVYGACSGGLHCDPVLYYYRDMVSEKDCVWAAELFKKTEKNNRAVCLAGDSVFLKKFEGQESTRPGTDN